MDPDATYIQIFDALAHSDMDTAVEKCGYLEEWLEKGGFAPQDFRDMPGGGRRECLEVIDWILCDLLEVRVR